MNNKPQFDTKILEKLRIGLEERLSKEFIIESINVDDDFLNRYMDSIVIRIRGFVWAEKDELARYPSNWKEAFKERWFPKWLLKRKPIMYDYIRALYPDYNPTIPNYEVRFMVERSDWHPDWEYHDQSDFANES